MTEKSAIDMDSKEFLEAKSLLTPNDILKPLDPSWAGSAIHEYELFTVYFKANEYDTVISMDVYRDRTFKIGGSTCVPTHRFLDYTDGYARARAFAAALQLRARL